MKRKGVIVRWDLKEALSKGASRCTKKPDLRHTVLDERATDREGELTSNAKFQPSKTWLTPWALLED